jgi:hypothetical protein
MTFISIKKLFLMILVGMGLAAFCLFYLTYLDESIVEGDAYGFVIGDSKYESYNKAKNSIGNIPIFGETEVFIYLNVDKKVAQAFDIELGRNRLIKVDFNDQEFKKIQVMDYWGFYFGESFNSSISLKFCDEKLCKIYRHRQYYEFF